MQTFYPSLKTNAEYRIPVAPPHELYVEEAGNPSGIPILVVHSGPGTGCEPFHRRFFDPEVYRIILFDQRGAGRSTPHACLEGNTTQDLIADMEIIRAHLQIEKWALWGGAWGSTLSLIYGQTYPEHVTGFILHSIFLGKQSDIDWFYQSGANRIFPDHFEDFMAPLNIENGMTPLKAYSERLNGSDELARMSTAKSWSLWQARCASLQPHQDILENCTDPHFAVGLASIECHYFKNGCFLKPNQILSNMDKIKDIPAYLIHGRYNIVCPLNNAWELHRAWDNSELYIIRDAGHSSREPGIIDANILASRQLAKNYNRSA